MDRRLIIQELTSLGYKLLRDDGGHSVYYKAGKPIATVPRHREVNENTARAILKEARRQ